MKKLKNLVPKIYYLKPRTRGMVWIGILILLIFILGLGLALISEVSTTIVQTKKSEQILVAQSLCEAGIEKALVELNKGGSYSGEDFTLETGDVEVDVTGSGNTRDILSTCYTPTKNSSTAIKRMVSVKVEADPRESGVAFSYAIQVGGLGVTMSPNSSVIGNVYVSGGITCGNNSSITGDAFSSKQGPDPGQEGTGTISGCSVGGNGSAYSFIDTDITGSAESVLWDSKSTAGGGHTTINSTQLKPYKSLPLNQGTIDIWEGWASDGGTHIGNYRLTTNQTGSLGPKKIEGDLILDAGSVLTVTGVLWVEGNVIFNSGSTAQLDPSFGPNSGIILADKPGSESGYGTIDINSNVTINGSGDPKSYIMMLSTNTKQTTADPAIFAGNNSTAVVYYTTDGMIEVNQNAHLKAVSGGGLHLSNGAVLTYDSGLADANFSGGPGGSWVVREWKIIYGD